VVIFQREDDVFRGSTFLDVQVPDGTPDLDLGVGNAFEIREWNFDTLEVH
jgi:hypothetical protein